MDWPAGHPLELTGRLSKAESLVFLGPDTDELARRLPCTRVGRIAAGQYDPVRRLPGADKRVLRVDTLLVDNRCARRSATQVLMTVLATVYVDFLHENRDRPNWTGLRWVPADRSYVDNGGQISWGSTPSGPLT
jgi:hypothetical protein